LQEKSTAETFFKNEMECEKSRETEKNREISREIGV
jgi:hypothetical protein